MKLLFLQSKGKKIKAIIENFGLKLLLPQLSRKKEFEHLTSFRTL